MPIFRVATYLITSTCNMIISHDCAALNNEHGYENNDANNNASFCVRKANVLLLQPSVYFISFFVVVAKQRSQYVCFVAFARKLLLCVNNWQQITVLLKKRSVIRFFIFICNYVWSIMYDRWNQWAMVSWRFHLAKSWSFMLHSHGTLRSYIRQLWDIVLSST